MIGVFIAVAVILGLLAGALLVASGIFFWYLLKTVRGLKESVEAFTRAVDPLIKTGALLTLADAAARCVGIANQMLAAMKNINTTVGLFNKAFFKKDAIEEVGTAAESPGDFAAADESAAFGYNEEEAAIREKQGQLRQMGYETDPTRVQEPASESMKGAQA